MRILAALLMGLALVACIEAPSGNAGAPAGPPPLAACVDSDRDGFGDGCTGGHDCDDTDALVHEGCLHCGQPDTGCACELGERPVSCFLDKTTASDGTVMCHEGTRYCRNGAWSACESVVSYALPAKAERQSLVAADAGPERCNDCAVNCFVVRDNLNPIDGGLGDAGVNTTIADGGGVTLIIPAPDAGSSQLQDAGTLDTSNCVIGVAPDWDCDGLLDVIDPYPKEKPFATANPAIFLDIAPGETGTGVIDLKFFMNTVDTYFLLDQTDTMQAVRTKLKGALTTGSFLPAATECTDTDFDGLPNNELKAMGIIGALRCLLRDARFGTGYVREIPFTSYGDADEILFRHMMDIGDKEADAIAAVNAMSTDKDTDWPDGQVLALYSLATGRGHYMGVSKPGVLPRVGCPGATWGYPCFRDEAVPVVVLFTDSTMHNGPPVVGQDYTYDATKLGITTGTSASYVTLPITNEDFPTTYAMGNLTNKRVTYAGDTSPMGADIGRTTMACLASGQDAAPDATFMFELSASKTVSFSTAGSEHTAALGLFTHVAENPTVVVGSGQNEESSTSQNLGDLYTGWTTITGDTTGMAANYTGAYAGCGASDASPDAAYRFTLPQATTVTIDASGSSFGTALSLYNPAPAIPAVHVPDNDNDAEATAHDLGDLFGGIATTTGATTNAPLIDADYSEAQLGCSAATASADAVYRFSLSGPTRVRIDTAGSGFDTVLSLTDGTLGSQTVVNVVNTNDTQATAKDIGNQIGGWNQYVGSTVALNADYRASFVGCGATTSSRDAVYKLSLSAPTNVRIDTVGSTLDTVISLHDGTIDPTMPLALPSNVNENDTSPQSLGGINDAWIEVSGGNTASMAADYAESVIGCGADSAAPDAVYSFSLSAPTKVHIDTVGSSYDTVLSLHDGPLPRDTVTTIGTPAETYVVGAVDDKSLVFTGSTATMSSDYGGEAMGCTASDGSRDAVFQLTLATPTSLEVSTEGSSFDTVLGLFPATVTSPKRPSTTAITNNNDSMASNPKDMGVLDGQWLVYSGDTSSLNADYGAFGCSVTASSKDAVFKFTLSAPRVVTFDTIGSAFDTVIGVFKAADDSLVGCDNDGGGGTASQLIQSLAAGDYYVVVKGQSGGAKGAYVLSVREHSVSTAISCNDDGVAVNGASKLIASLLPGTYHVVLKGGTDAASGAYRIRFRDLDFFGSTHRLACNDDGGGGNAAQIETELAAGTYYVVVKGDLASDSGAYKLSVRDANSAATTSHMVACDDDSGGGTASQLVRQLAAGDHWVVVKSKSSTGGAYNLNVRDIGAAAMGSMIGCNDDAGGGLTTSAIEQDLAAGTYYVFVKGDADADKGGYTLNLRDVTNTTTGRLQCDSSSGTAGAGRIVRALPAGVYWVVVKGTSPTAQGAYALSVRDTANATRQTLACDLDGTFSQMLAPGRYDLVLKGAQTANLGRFALTVGGGATQSGTYVPPTWTETLDALKDNGVRVITVLNCHDNGIHGDGRDCDHARSAAQTLANATDTLGSNLQPLVVDIAANGTGLEQAVVDEIQALSGYLSMNVSVRVVFEPDANPGFQVSVAAIDLPGDGCDGLIGIEHQRCRPGATPTFHIKFTNPLSAPVPLNPNDPNGGYSFRADLIADGRYFVDAVPIYIIPKDLAGSGPPPPPQISAEGTYTQDISSSGCAGNQRADWRDLSWNANVPSGTSVTFSACTGDQPTELDTCAFARICSISGANACTSDADCANGFCAVNGVCQTITAGACTMDADCTSGARCVGNLCTFSAQPVYIGNSLNPGDNNKTYLRMQIKLTANSMANVGPTVYDWALTYLCGNVL